MSVTTSQWPASATRSTSPFITSTMVSCRRRSPRRERLGRQAAQPMVGVSLEAQQAVDHLVPQRTRSDALDEQIDAGRNLEPGVPKHGSDQVVGEHFGSERSQRDRCLPLRVPRRGRSRGSFLGVVCERRKIGVENACGSGTYGHDGLLSADPRGAGSRTTLKQCMATSACQRSGFRAALGLPHNDLFSLVAGFPGLDFVAFLRGNCVAPTASVSRYTYMQKCIAFIFGEEGVIAWMGRSPTVPFHSKLSQVIFARGRCRNGLCSVRPNRSWLTESPSPRGLSRSLGVVSGDTKNDLRGAPKPAQPWTSVDEFYLWAIIRLPHFHLDLGFRVRCRPHWWWAVDRAFWPPVRPLWQVFTLRIAGFGTMVYLADPDDIKTVFAGEPGVFHAGEANQMFSGLPETALCW